MMKVACFTISILLAYCITMYNFDYLITACARIKHPNELVKDNIPSNRASSVWCRVSNGTRLCTFINLCYEPEIKQFLFTLTEHSIIFGLTSKEDLKYIRLSSVMNHNLFSMKVAVIGPENKALERGTVISQHLFLLWRFKLDNIMHIIHDDALPLYLTYLEICKDLTACISKYTLGFVDRGENGPYEEIYSLFSKQEPRLLHKEKSLVCFPEVHAGVLSTSAWFQYGFGKPHGPINNSIPAALLHGFREFIFHSYDLSLKDINSNNTVVIFNRKLNRRILNYDYVSSEVNHIILQAYPSSHYHVIELDLSTHNFSSLLKFMLTSRIVVGMHGSAMILCMFLKPGSVVVELFPYAIQPKYVSFLKAFSSTIGAGIIYRSWVNTNESLSVSHPDAPPLLGGIHHLPVTEQELIKKTKIVPAVECCHDPMYLFRMFQDTVIGSDFGSIFLEVLLEQKCFSKETFEATYVDHLFMSWYFPASVTNVTCFLFKETLNASWEPSINSASSLIYDVAILMENGKSIMRRTSEHQLNINTLSHSAQTAQVWIKAVSHESESVDVHARCLRIL